LVIWIIGIEWSSIITMKTGRIIRIVLILLLDSFTIFVEWEAILIEFDDLNGTRYLILALANITLGYMIALIIKLTRESVWMTGTKEILSISGTFESVISVLVRAHGVVVDRTTVRSLFWIFTISPLLLVLVVKPPRLFENTWILKRFT